MNVHILAFYKKERVLANSKPALRVIGSSTLRKGSLQIANLFLTQWDTETTRYDAKLPNAFQLIPVPIHWQLALFPVWKRDPKLARVAEVVGSTFCSSYWCYGGLNMTEAGYSTITDRTPDFEDILWEESIREAFKRINEYGLADEERQFWLDRDRTLEATQELPQSEIGQFQYPVWQCCFVWA